MPSDLLNTIQTSILYAPPEAAKPPARRFSERVSWARLLFWIGIMVALIAVANSRYATGFADKPNRGPGDLELYQAEVEQMQTGANYYDIAANELVSRGYPTRSVFNWRTPLPMILIAKLGPIGAHAILIAAASFMILMALPALYRSGGMLGTLLGAIGLIGASLPVGLTNAWYLPEVWSGIFIGFSIVAYYTDRRILAVVGGIAALFLRELAFPYVMICYVMSKRQKNYVEFALWCVGLVAYASFYCWHLSNVVPRIGIDAIAHQQSWIAWGGASFLISLVQMNIWLLMVPQTASAVVLAMALAGWSGAETEWEKRLAWTGVAYVFIFAIVGMPINQYWGSQIAPLVALGAAQFMRGITRSNETPKKVSKLTPQQRMEAAVANMSYGS